MANKIQKSVKADASNAIKIEISRFESVHPNIYAIYELIEQIDDSEISESIKENIKDYVVSIEDSFVNSQEWTLPRFVNVLKLAIVGTVDSGKSALVHRYLTGTYIHDESPEGGRFKKEVVLDGQSCLLLIRDEGGCPEKQMTQWADGVVLVFSLENEQSLCIVAGEYYRQMSSHRDLSDVPLLLVGTQDAICDSSPRQIDDSRARRVASQLGRRGAGYYETCATYGLNVDRVFLDVCSRILSASHSSSHNAIPNRTNGPQATSTSHNLRSRPTTPQITSPNTVLMMPHPLGALTQPKQRPIQSSMANFDPNNNSNTNNPASTSSNSNNFSRTGSYLSNSSSHKNPVQQGEEEPPPLPARPENMAPLRPVDPRMRIPVSGSNSKNPTESMSNHNEFETSYLKSLPMRSSSNQHQMIVPTATGDVANNNHQMNNNGQLHQQLQQQHVYSEYNMLMSSSSLSTARQTPNSSIAMATSAQHYTGNPNNNTASLSMTNNFDFTPPMHRPKPNSTDKDITGSNEKTSQKQQNSNMSGNANGTTVMGSGRSIPVKQGYLYKKSSNQLNRDRKNRKYVTLTEDAKLTYYSTMNDYMNQVRGKEINLQLTSIKLPGVPYRNSCLPTTAPSSQGTPAFANAPNTPTQRSSDSSNAPIVSDSMTTAYLAELGISPGGDARNSKDTKNKRHRRMKSSIKSGTGGNDDNDGEVYEFILVDSDGRQWQFEGSTMEERDDWVVQIEGVVMQKLQLDSSNNCITGGSGSGGGLGNSHSGVGGMSGSNAGGGNQLGGQMGGGAITNNNILAIISSVAGNETCADCGTNEPQWASLNLGVCICIECCGVHRQLGSHVSRVRSLTLDDWPAEHVMVMRAIGNTMANSVWEARHAAMATAGPSGAASSVAPQAAGAGSVAGGAGNGGSTANSNATLTKPSPSSPRVHKEAWIRAKYESRLYLPPLPHPDAPVQQQLVDAISRQDTRQLLLCLAVIGCNSGGGNQQQQGSSNSNNSSSVLDSAYSEQDSRTPLHIAATLGNVVYLQLLLWAGASVSATDIEGRSAFFYAFYSGQVKAANFLLRNSPPNGGGSANVANMLAMNNINCLATDDLIGLQQQQQQQQQQHMQSTTLPRQHYTTSGNNRTASAGAPTAATPPVMQHPPLPPQHYTHQTIDNNYIDFTNQPLH